MVLITPTVLKLFIVPLKLPLNKILPSEAILGLFIFCNAGITIAKSTLLVLIEPLLKSITVLLILGKPFMAKLPEILVVTPDRIKKFLNVKSEIVPKKLPLTTACFFQVFKSVTK